MRSLGVAPDGSEQFIGHDSDGKLILNTKYADASAVTDQNARLRGTGFGNGKDMKLAASIPLSLVMKWRVEQGVDVFSSDPDQQRAARRLLNDHQYKMLRVWEGRL